uniref:Ribosomal protein L16 n=1 Tax=Symphyocladia marchantioides TaxID=88360 RepID=UPI0022FD3E48|nr:Ribosomal protein L16 [Symphyocladia marchantioides]WAX04042.1 Ribosomal protein L16 [Symphyocladia marchantioides]
MKKKINSFKKYHFKFKRLLSFQKHILKFGVLGFKIQRTCCITDVQEGLLKLFILKNLKIISSIKTKIFFTSKCFYSATKLPLESRMGKGKGEICHFFGYYKKGFILFELKAFSLVNALRLQKVLNLKKIIKAKIIF